MPRITRRTAATALSALLLAATAAGPVFAATTQGNSAATIAAANLGKGPCSTNNAGGTGFLGSCSGEEWCADFAKWTWNQAGVTDTGVITAAAYTFAKYGTAHGTFHWVSDSSYTPQPGDAVIWAGNGRSLPSDPNNLGFDDVEHVNLVQSASSRTNITTIGGNEGNSVQQKTGVNPTVNQDWGQKVIGYISPVGSPVTPPAAMPRSSSSGLTARPDGGYTTAWKGTDGKLWIGTGSGTSMAQPAAPWLLGVAQGSKPSIATLSDGSWVTAWAGEDGKLWIGTGIGTNMARPAEPWLLGVYPGTSPSITALSTGGWEVAWKGGDGRLWIATGSGTNMAQPAEPWLLGVADTTSPSIAALPNGGYEVAWKGSDGRLWLATGSGTNMAQPASPWLLGVDTAGSSSSPSLATLPNGGYEVAWKGGDGRLWIATGSGTNMAQPAEPWLLGVA
ncbi:CHAP domain-containing protein [Kitasatospora sp. NPDC090091]|uniref:CHAP domain-containing protein n=1 Tax=Kitasatospora sp. NPDC090091 TaxID=3364081 RepID=UPI00380E2CE6